MNKALLLTAITAVVAGFLSTDAQADPRIRPALSTIASTRIVGTINVPAPPTGELAGFACPNLYVSATSKDTIPPPPGGLFSTPKWTRGVAATGTYSSGKCSYSMVVPGNSEFYLNVSGNGSFACSYVATWVGPTGAAVGPISVQIGTSKTQNLDVTKVLCEYIN